MIVATLYRIVDSLRRSFEHGALVDRERSMNDVALDGTTLQRHPDRPDSPLDAAADRDFLGLDAALDVRALADHELAGAHLALDAPEHVCRTVAFNGADDRHVGADAGDG